MYIAHFKAEKEEPKIAYFKARATEPKVIEFSAKEEKPVRLIIDKNFKMGVES